MKSVLSSRQLVIMFFIGIAALFLGTSGCRVTWADTKMSFIATNRILGSSIQFQDGTHAVFDTSQVQGKGVVFTIRGRYSPNGQNSSVVPRISPPASAPASNQ